MRACTTGPVGPAMAEMAALAPWTGTGLEKPEKKKRGPTSRRDKLARRARDKMFQRKHKEVKDGFASVSQSGHEFIESYEGAHTSKANAVANLTSPTCRVKSPTSTIVWRVLLCALEASIISLKSNFCVYLELR